MLSVTSFRKLLIISLALLASGCGTGISSDRTIGKPCPPLASYSAGEQVAADRELGAIPPPCVVCGMLDDYGLMRDQCR
jgi:hypothetical protein